MHGIRAGLFLKKNPFRATIFFISIYTSLTVGCVQTLHILGYYTGFWQKGKIEGLKTCKVFEQNLIFHQNKKNYFLIKIKFS